MTESPAPKSPVDLWLDLVLFAPAGFLVDARELVPKLAERGREQLDVQLRVARMIGKFAVRKGQSEVGKMVGRLVGRPEPAPRQPASAPPRAPATSPLEDAALVDTYLADEMDEIVIPVRIEGDPHENGHHDAGIDAADLAIPQYDALAASQVVPRLDGLTPAELDAVRRYEAAHRGRKTILGKIAQLQEG